MHEPFVIANRTVTAAETVCVTLREGNHKGRGEAMGVFFLGETVTSMVDAIEALRPEIEGGLLRATLQSALPAGGARAALDCAFWDLEAKRSGKTIWDLTGLSPQPLTTVYTISMNTPEIMAENARSAQLFPTLKIKLDTDDPIHKVEAVRKARPDARLIVDANQAWTPEALRDYLPALHANGILMVEQPLPRGQDRALEALVSPIPIGGDESLLDRSDFNEVGHLYDVVNVKLDKTGGLTEALALCDDARQAGKTIMVGNMGGTSLSMAPSFVIGQVSRFVDLDGPLYLNADVDHALAYSDRGVVHPPQRCLWG